MKILKNNKYGILKIIARYSFVFILVFSFLTPFVFITHAENNLGSNDGINIKTTIDNPLGNNLNSIPSFIEEILNIVLYIGIPIVTLAIIYSGFLFVTAQGNSDKLKTAKNTLLYTIIGAALLLGAFVLANAIGSTVDQIKSSA